MYVKNGICIYWTINVSEFSLKISLFVVTMEERIMVRHKAI